MTKKQYIGCLTILLFLSLVLPFDICAERVKPLNPDCDVCPVVISYEGDEAKAILGKDAVQKIIKLGSIREKTIKIDLDGVRRTGSEKDPDTGYELLVIIRPHMIAINPIKGTGGIKIITDLATLISGGEAWNPMIELMPPNGHEIDRTDDLETAWLKMKTGNIYQYVNNDMNHDMWKNRLQKFILNILEAGSRNE